MCGWIIIFNFERNCLISFLENGRNPENRKKWLSDAGWLATQSLDKTDQKNYTWERKRSYFFDLIYVMIQGIILI